MYLNWSKIGLLGLFCVIIYSIGADSQLPPSFLDGYLDQFQSSCGQDFSHERYIINGTDLEDYEFPSAVQVLVNEPQCAGTLISDRHVITAKHCVINEYGYNLPTSMIGVIMGTKDVRIEPDPNYVYKVESVCAGNYDAALLTLQEPVEFTHHIQPACWPDVYQDLSYDNQECYAVGGGVVETPYPGPKTVLPDRLQKLQVGLVPCNFENQVDSDVCYDNDMGVACSGDSGGPVLCRHPNENKWYVMGIFSRTGIKREDEPYPGISSMDLVGGCWPGTMPVYVTTDPNIVPDLFGECVVDPNKRPSDY